MRLHDGVVYAGERELGRGRRAGPPTSVADALVEAKSGLAHQLEAFAANTIEFMRRERALLLDGAACPTVDVDWRAPGRGGRRRLRRPPRRSARLQPLHPRVPAGAGRGRRGRGRAARPRATSPPIVWATRPSSNEA